MPLIKSGSTKARQENIKEMIAFGHNPRQAVAAGYANQRRYRDSGGANIPIPQPKPTYMPPNMFRPLSADQVAMALPKSSYTPLHNFHGQTSGMMPGVMAGMPDRKPPIPQYTGGRLHRAGGGTALSFVPPPAIQDAGAPTSSMPASMPQFGNIVAQINSQGMPQATPSATLPNSAGKQISMYQPSSYSNPLNAGASTATTPTQAPASTPSSSAQQQIYSLLNGGYSPVTLGGGGNYYFNPNTGINSPANTQSDDKTIGGLFTKGDNGYIPYIPSKNGGGIPQFAQGGMPQISQMSPWWTKHEAESFHPGGMFHGAAPGRADTIPTSVAADSHIIPADVVSGLGEGNSLAGAKVMDRVFQSGPYGVPLSHGHASLHVPSAPAFHDAAGGRKSPNGHKTVPIAASSGEYNISPQAVYRTGLVAAKNMKLDPKKLTPRKVMDMGHDTIDAFIVNERKKHIKTLVRLPPPRRD